jgi:DNA repair photolyase
MLEFSRGVRLARTDFELFKSFGARLVFGMSLPTLRNDLAKVYEPKAPAPSQRLAALLAAKRAGLHVYVAIAPTYPECDEADLRTTLQAVAELDPITIFHEPINIRAENVARIELHAAAGGVALRSYVFATRESWQRLRRKRPANRRTAGRGNRRYRQATPLAGQITGCSICGRADVERGQVFGMAESLVASDQ